MGTIIQWIGMLTGTWDRNASLVMRWILLMKFIADVLHSSASIWKWSRTSKVNTVWGFLKLAGKSLTRSRSWTYWSNDLAQWHHRTERLKIPVDDTTIRLDCDRNCVLQPLVGWVSKVSAHLLPLSDTSRSDMIPSSAHIYILFLIHSELNGLEPKMDTFLVKVN